jgi:cytochrome P450
VASLVRPFLRSRLLEVIGGKPVRDNNRLIDYGKAQVQARRGNEGAEKGSHDAKDFLSKLAYHDDKKTGWRPATLDLDTESLNMIIAGADPYSEVFTGVLFYLVHNPDCLAKATAEIRYVRQTQHTRPSLI